MEKAAHVSWWFPITAGENGMFYLLVTLSLLSMGTGVFIVGFGVPIRETVFGAGLLVAGTVAITGGFVLVGLAAAIAELQLMVKALRARVPGVPRPLRPVDRKDGSERRPGPPRILMPPRPDAAAPPPADTELFPSTAPPQPEMQDPVRKPVRPEWLRRAMAEITSTPDPANGGPDPWPHSADPPPPAAPPHGSAPENGMPETRPPPPSPATAPNRFDAIWPSDRRKAADAPPEKRAEPELRPPDNFRPPDTRPPRFAPPVPTPPPPLVHAPPPPDSAPDRTDQPQVAILKSGMIDEMAYTLFTDGSIEAQMPDGIMRFASIDELREHLEQHGG